MVQFFRLYKTEVKRVFQQPWIYLGVMGVFLVRFMGTFCSEVSYEQIFVLDNRQLDVLNLFILYSDDSFLGFTSFCLCAFPVVGNLMTDYKSGRLNTILLRSKRRHYAEAKVFSVITVPALCMFWGDVLCIVSGTAFLRMPFFSASFNSDPLLEQGHYILYFLFHELQYSMQASFYALLTLAVSVWVHEVQFLVALPMILRYFAIYFVNSYYCPWLPEMLSPRSIYIAGLLFHDQMALEACYAFFYTLCIGILVMALLVSFLKKQRR